MTRMIGIAFIALTFASVPGLSQAEGMSWEAFFADYCAWGHKPTCVPAAEQGYKRGKTVQETVDDIAALRGGAMPVAKFSHIGVVASYQEFFDKAGKLDPVELNRGQTEFKDKPEALLAKFAEIRGECGVIVDLLDKRSCYEQAIAKIIPGKS